VASLDQPLSVKWRAKGEFVNRFKLMQMYSKNIWLGRNPKSTPSSALSRLASEGRIAIVTDVGCEGCGGRFGGALTNEAEADGEVGWS
jgi:hypothetical protein